MACIMIRSLDDGVKTRLRVRAGVHSRSMEEAVRVILREAANSGKAGPGDLARSTRVCFASPGGVEFRFPPRGPMRVPPDSSWAASHVLA